MIMTLQNSRWKYLFLFLILCDIVYSFLQNTNTMFLDGDMAGIIVPADAYKRVMSDPFGIGTLIHHDMYAAPNRFFIHWIMQKYFHTVPFLLQRFTDPVNSAFLSIAIARTLIQVLIIYLISVFASARKNPLNINLLVAALVITPLFQVNGYYEFMAITLNSVTYTFFYALPFIFLLLYFYPFMMHSFHGKPLFRGPLPHLFLFALALIIAFGGPLGPPAIIILVPLLGGGMLIRNYRTRKGMSFLPRMLKSFFEIPLQYRIHFIAIVLLCIYSFYIGTYNVENTWETLPLSERYSRLWPGFWAIISVKLGLPLLLAICVVNGIWIYRLKLEVSRPLVHLIRLLGVFSVIYLLLLPLGGYRAYRPLIIRCDTFSPVTICMMLIYGLTFLILLSHYKGKIRWVLIFMLTILIYIYTNYDRVDWKVNQCQRDYLYQISASTERVVALHGWCNLLSWWRYKTPDESELNAELIRYWKITKDKKLYYQPE